MNLLWEQLVEPMNELPLPESEVLELQKRLTRIHQNPLPATPWREFIKKPD